VPGENSDSLVLYTYIARASSICSKATGKESGLQAVLGGDHPVTQA